MSIFESASRLTKFTRGYFKIAIHSLSVYTLHPSNNGYGVIFSLQARYIISHIQIQNIYDETIPLKTTIVRVFWSIHCVCNIAII